MKLKHFGIIWVFGLILNLAILGGIIWVAWHFISKWW